MAPILLIFLRINCYASVLFSAKAKKHLIEGLTSLGLISNSMFMARLSDWMGAWSNWEGAWPDLPPGCASDVYGQMAYGNSIGSNDDADAAAVTALLLLLLLLMMMMMMTRIQLTSICGGSRLRNWGPTLPSFPLSYPLPFLPSLSPPSP